MMKSRAAPENAKQQLKFIEHYKVYCELRRVHFKTLNNLNASLEPDFVLTLPRVKPDFDLYFI